MLPKGMARLNETVIAGDTVADVDGAPPGTNKDAAGCCSGRDKSGLAMRFQLFQDLGGHLIA